MSHVFGIAFANLEKHRAEFWVWGAMEQLCEASHNCSVATETHCSALPKAPLQLVPKFTEERWVDFICCDRT
jgi:hypothetical protein